MAISASVRQEAQELFAAYPDGATRAKELIEENNGKFPEDFSDQESKVKAPPRKPFPIERWLPNPQ